MKKLEAYCGPTIQVINEDGSVEVTRPDGTPLNQLVEPGEQDAFTPPPPSPDVVDAERDRRTVDNFIFNGTPFRLDEKSISRITAMGADARFAIAGGAQAGNLRWADPDNDFGFIASDNSVVPMDAPTMVAFSTAAKLWVARNTFAGRAIKDFDPIPADFADDAYWPESTVQ